MTNKVIIGKWNALRNALPLNVELTAFVKENQTGDNQRYVRPGQKPTIRRFNLNQNEAIEQQNRIIENIQIMAKYSLDGYQHELEAKLHSDGRVIAAKNITKKPGDVIFKNYGVLLSEDAVSEMVADRKVIFLEDWLNDLFAVIKRSKIKPAGLFEIITLGGARHTFNYSENLVQELVSLLDEFDTISANLVYKNRTRSDFMDQILFKITPKSRRIEHKIVEITGCEESYAPLVLGNAYEGKNLKLPSELFPDGFNTTKKSDFKMKLTDGNGNVSFCMWPQR